jgi:type I restriction enzyme S subunit
MMEGWKTDKLMNLVSSITTGKLDANAMVPNGQYRFYTCAKEFFQIDKYAFDDEALLISGNGEYVGYIHYYKGKFNAYQRVYVITGFKIDVKYLQNYLNRYLPIRINKEVSQNNIPYIRLSTLSKMDIKYPESKFEQSAIAAIFSKVDEAIASVQASISAAERLKKSLMQNLLTGRMKPDGTLRKEDEFYVDEKFGRVPVGWEVKKVGEVFDTYPTASYSRSKLLETGNCKYIHYGDIHTKFDTFLDVSNTELPFVSDDMIKNFVFLKDGDIVIADTSEDYEGVGKLVEISNIGKNKVISGLHTLLIRSKSDALINGYKGYMFNEERVMLSLLKFVTGIKVYSISKSCLARVLIPIPTIEEQKQIKSKLDSVNSIILQKKDEINTLERLKKSLMQNLLTGRVRINSQ